MDARSVPVPGLEPLGLCGGAILANVSFRPVLDEGMRQPTVHLLPVEDDALKDLLAVAVAEADPEEAMPPRSAPCTPSVPG